ncbi:MAG: hypothetical protein KAI22_08425, partial [Gammaproteobacteria bacterium]|nr:hypothetical protein [Gammaproteobacteria bacterium]
MPEQIELLEESFYVLGALYFLLEMVGIYYAFHAVLNTRTSQAAIAWAISLIIIPPIILPLYLIFGNSRFYAYMESFRQARLEDIDTARKALQQIEQYHVNHINNLQGVTSTINNLQHLPFTSHNSV